MCPFFHSDSIGFQQHQHINLFVQLHNRSKIVSELVHYTTRTNTLTKNFTRSRFVWSSPSSRHPILWVYIIKCCTHNYLDFFFLYNPCRYGKCGYGKIQLSALILVFFQLHILVDLIFWICRKWFTFPKNKIVWKGLSMFPIYSILYR